MKITHLPEDGKNFIPYGGDYHGLNTSGERLPICGGYWNNTSDAGVFFVYLNNPRPSAYGNLGFRSAFVN